MTQKLIVRDPRVYTEEECREKFLRHLAGYVRYWLKEKRAATVEEKLAGLAFSMLVMIDGGTVELPSFKLSPAPHDDDKEYCQKNGEDWWPQEKDAVDIGGGLHEEWHKYYDPAR